MFPPKPIADEHGMINGLLLIGQATYKLPEDQILLALKVVKNPQELQAMKGETIQLFLTKIQAMELARMLTDAGENPSSK